MPIMVERQKYPLSSVSGWFFLSVDAHLGPQTVELTTCQSIFGQQYLFDCFCVLTSLANPVRAEQKARRGIIRYARAKCKRWSSVFRRSEEGAHP
jgi:hypothetical protein